jgi:hypothetical protein
MFHLFFFQPRRAKYNLLNDTIVVVIFLYLYLSRRSDVTSLMIPCSENLFFFFPLDARRGSVASIQVVLDEHLAQERKFFYHAPVVSRVEPFVVPLSRSYAYHRYIGC